MLVFYRTSGPLVHYNGLIPLVHYRPLGTAVLIALAVTLAVLGITRAVFRRQ